MSSLRSVLDELQSEDLRSFGDDELESRVVELHRAADVLLAERTRTLSEVERRGLSTRDGHLSTAAWLADRARVSYGVAKAEVTTAHALEDMPVTRKALADGTVTGSSLRVLVSAFRSNPDEFPRAEEALLDLAQESCVKEFTARVAEWRRDADATSGELERRQHERRRLDAAPTLEGMIRVEGELDPEAGETVITALRAFVDADMRGEGDPRTPTQRRADAMTEICRRWLDSPNRPNVAGERPHVTVVLEAGGGHTPRASLEDAGPIGEETARRIMCDASISRVVAKGRSEPFDVGRKTPVVSAALRRAVVVRDRNCRFPGCDRPQSWCDAHHVVHWADGGETSLNNLLLLCRPHHRLVHQGFRIEREAGGFTFKRPDGSPLEDRAPP